MVKKSVVVLVGVGVLAAVASLWLRVRELEQTVDSLTRQLQSRPPVVAVPVREPLQREQSEQRQIFRLIESGEKYAEPTEGPFHPDVDRAMMIDAIQLNSPARGVDPIHEPSAQIEVSPGAAPITIPDLNSLPDSVEPFRKMN